MHASRGRYGSECRPMINCPDSGSYTHIYTSSLLLRAGDFAYLTIILCHLWTLVAIILIFFHSVIKDIELYLAKLRSLQNLIRNIPCE